MATAASSRGLGQVTGIKCMPSPAPAKGPQRAILGRHRARCKNSGNGATATSCRGYFISVPRVQDVRGIRRYSRIGNHALPQRASSEGCSPKPTRSEDSSLPKPSRPGRNKHINHWKSPIFTFGDELWAVSLNYLVIPTLSTLSHLQSLLHQRQQGRESSPK